MSVDSWGLKEVHIMPVCGLMVMGIIGSPYYANVCVIMGFIGSPHYACLWTHGVYRKSIFFYVHMYCMSVDLWGL